MRVAIAGGHGQIALRLAKILSERGDEVVAAIRNPDHAGDVRNAGASTKDQTLSAALHGEALLAAQDASMLPLLERLAALTNGHDDVRLEIAGRIAGRAGLQRWIATPAMS